MSVRMYVYIRACVRDTTLCVCTCMSVCVHVCVCVSIAHAPAVQHHVPILTLQALEDRSWFNITISRAWK